MDTDAGVNQEVERMEDQPENFFELADFRDLYWKCHAELKPALTLSDAKQRCYAMFNLALSLNHLLDWVLEDPSVPKDLKGLCLQTFNPYAEGDNLPFKKLFSTITPFPKRNDAQYLIRQVANRAKHLKRFSTRPTMRRRCTFRPSRPSPISGAEIPEPTVEVLSR